MIKNRVLYFEDDNVTAEVVSKGLKSYHWNIHVVSSISDFFEELRTNYYDALIMDIMAPIAYLDNNYVSFNKTDIKRMNEGKSTGIVLTEKIWETKDYTNIPVLYYSAKDKDSFVPIDGKKYFYLSKPEFVKTINDKLILLLNS